MKPIYYFLDSDCTVALGELIELAGALTSVRLLELL